MNYQDDQNALLNWLQDWAAAQCNDYWEHLSAVSITMLDNPGWNVKVQLEGTEFEGIEQELEMHHVNEDDWFGFKVEYNLFEGFGDIYKLAIIIKCFKEIVNKKVEHP